MSPTTLVCLMAVLPSDMSGAEIVRYAQSDIMNFGYIKRDGVYKALVRLEKDGLVASGESLGMRTYRLTPQGKKVLISEARRLQDVSGKLRSLLQQNP